MCLHRQNVGGYIQAEHLMILFNQLMIRCYFKMYHFLLPPLVFDYQSLQTGTFRMNCLDCLDRSNSVQSFVAQEVSLSLLWDTCRTFIGCSMGKTGKRLYVSVSSMIQNDAGWNTEDKKQKYFKHLKTM